LPAANAYFQKQKAKTNRVNEKAAMPAKRRMFEMMQEIAAQIDESTEAFTLPSDPIALDLCMAPGGFLAYFLQRCPRGSADSITLPSKDGGHTVLVRCNKKNRLHVVFADITMFANELGIQTIPDDHPEAEKLRTPWPYPDKTYDLLLCDGQALSTQNVPEYRRQSEQSRLLNSQLGIALHRVRPGGTIVVLLHKSFKWRTFVLLHSFSKFSDVQLFKPLKFHAQKSSFYLVAKNVQPKSGEAANAVESFRQSWMRNTFQDGADSGDSKPTDMREVGLLLEEFGSKFMNLAEPTWRVQATALENAPWMTK
jgi:23S rRNA U2552 (ribose-2'-O)-methylase RlmE/FtsJ